jgi:hypothetical protein
MTRVPLRSALLALAAALAVAGAGEAAAKATVTRIDRCNGLERQFDRAIIEHASAKRAAEARALQGKAVRLCAGKAQAQGIRAYAEALKLLGVQPRDP